MNNRDKNIGVEAGQWAEEVLCSIDGISRARSNPFLFTRIKARIDERYGMWEKVANLLAKPAFALGTIVLFIGINIAVIVSGKSRNNQPVAVKPTEDQMLAAEFINVPNYSLVELNEEK